MMVQQECFQPKHFYHQINLEQTVPPNRSWVNLFAFLTFDEDAILSAPNGDGKSVSFGDWLGYACGSKSLAYSPRL